MCYVIVSLAVPVVEIGL